MEAEPLPSVETFIDRYIVIDDAQDQGDGLGVMPFVLWPAQRALLHDMQTETRTAALARIVRRLLITQGLDQ